MSQKFIALFALLWSGVSAQQSQCTEDASRIGDGRCNAFNNNAACEYDGGDCCYRSCLDGLEYICGSFGFDCQDPDYMGDEDCNGEQIADGPCSAGTLTQMIVNDTASAAALADAIRCCGGAFNVLWRGHVAVNRTIEVVDEAILSVTGVGSGAEMQATPGTRIIAAINASLEISNIKIAGGNASLGGAIAAVGSYVALENTSFAGNDAVVEGGALYAISGSIVSCAGRVLFDGNHAGGMGGAVSVKGASMVMFYGHTTFTNNTAGGKGGALNVIQSSAFWAGDAVFSGNTAHDSGGALLARHSDLFWGGDASFSDNVAAYTGGALFVDSSSTLSWTGDAYFSNNTADWGGGALMVSSSNLSWAGDAYFSNNTVNGWGGAIDVHFSNLAWVGDAYFSDNTGHFGGALDVLSSTLSWAGDTYFSENTAYSNGGALDVSSSTLSRAGDAYFSDNTAHGVGGALSVSPSTPIRQRTISVSASTLSWACDAHFSGNTAYDNGGALYISSSTGITWAGHATFFNNTAKDNGGALYVTASSNVSLARQASFIENTAGRNGGALFITNGVRALLKLDTLFLRNRASIGDGGALYMYGSDEGQPTSVDITSTVKFLNNLCGGDGGALVMVGAAWVKLPSQRSTFCFNSAQTAGGAIAVKGVPIGPQFTGLTFQSNDAQVGGAVYVTSSGNAITENRFGDPSQNPTTFDRCIFIGNKAKATGGAIDTGAGLDAISNTSFVGNTARAGGALRLAGITTLDNCTFTENVSENGEGPAVSNVGAVSRIAACSFVNNAFTCKAWEFLDYYDTDNSSRTFDLICKECDAECPDCITSSLAPMCTEVLDNTKSPGGNTTIEALEIDPGYWRATKTSRKVVACYNTDACNGGETGAFDYCTTGYEGPYCSICRGGYSPGLGHTCNRCSQSDGSVVVTVIFATASTVVVVLLLCFFPTSRESTTEDRGRQASLRRRLLSLKMIIIVWQITAQFASVANVMYPEVYQSFLDIVDVVNLDVGWILSAECIIDLDFHHRLVMYTLGPFVALVILGGMSAVGRWRNGAANEEDRRKHLFSLLLLLTFLVYSSVSSTLFRMFACDKLDDGTSYLRADYRIDCESPTHRALQAYAACMMLVYTGGIPVLYGILLFRNRQTLMDGSARQTCGVTRSISSLWELYKPRCFYYELIECARRILLAGVVVFMFPNTTAQVGIALMIAAFFMVFSEMLAPFESVWDAWINRLGHGLVFGSIYLAFLLKIDLSDEREDSQRLFESILIAGHVSLILLATSGVAMVTSRWINGSG